VEYQRRRQDLEQKRQALAAQEKQIEAQVDRQGELAGMARSIEAFCQRVRAGLAEATFEQKRTLVELLIDRVLVNNGDVEVRYIIPTAPRGETPPFCQLRKDYFQVPLVARPGPAPSQLIGIILPELAAPLADRFVGHGDPTFHQKLLDVAVAQGEAVVQPDPMTDDFAWKAMVLITFRVCGRGHVGS